MVQPFFKELMNFFKFIYKFFEWIYYILVIIVNAIKVISFSSSYESKPSQQARDNKDFNQRLVDDELYNKEYGLLKKESTTLDNAVKKVIFWNKKAGFNQTENITEQREAKNETYRQAEPLKAKGDKYEYYIGRQFEKNNNLVIYNGFINGYADKGIDLIVISNESVNLVQCKNWKSKPITVDDIKNIYSKLDNYNIGHYLYMECADINFYLEKPRSIKAILSILHESKKYPVRKTLYISSNKVVDLKIGQHLKMMAPNIFKYKDMKMVVKDMVL
jgi:hypothetical protein